MYSKYDFIAKINTAIVRSIESRSYLSPLEKMIGRGKR